MNQPCKVKSILLEGKAHTWKCIVFVTYEVNIRCAITEWLNEKHGWEGHVNRKVMVTEVYYHEIGDSLHRVQKWGHESSLDEWENDSPDLK